MSGKKNEPTPEMPIASKTMDEKQIKTEMRMRALEVVVTTLLALNCVQSTPDDPLGAFAKMREKLAEAASSWVFPDLDPTMSDHYAAELTEALNRLLDTASPQIAKMLEVLQKYRQ